jgi:hypothetical protein
MHVESHIPAHLSPIASGVFGDAPTPAPVAAWIHMPAHLTPIALGVYAYAPTLAPVTTPREGATKDVE